MPKSPKTSIEQVFKALLTFIPSPRFTNTRETTHLRIFPFAFALLLFFNDPKNYFKRQLYFIVFQPSEIMFVPGFCTF